MPDERIIELVPILLEWQEEGVRVLLEFLELHATKDTEDIDNDNYQDGDQYGAL